MPEAVNYDYSHLPEPLPIRPFSALHAFFKLLANNDDTTQTYRILHSVSGDAYRRGFEHFVATAEGRRVIETPIKIEEIFADVENLRSYPPNTVGRMLGDFLGEECLSAGDLLKAAERAGFDFNSSNENAAFRRYFIHFELSHDLWHVLTGYGRDALGELCLLEFTRAQWPNWGMAIMCKLGVAPPIPTYGLQKTIMAVREAWVNGLHAQPLIEENIESLLAMDMLEARRRLLLSPRQNFYFF